MAKGSRPSGAEKAKQNNSNSTQQQPLSKEQQWLKDQYAREAAEKSWVESFDSRVAKLPTYGKKVQEAFIDLVKRNSNVDLSKARDTYFDNNRGFNVDIREVVSMPRDGTGNKQQVFRGDLRNIAKGGKWFDVEVAENGAYRYFIRVTKKKK